MKLSKAIFLVYFFSVGAQTQVLYAAYTGPYKIVGYYPQWWSHRTFANSCRLPFNPHLLTHINYAFAKIDSMGNILFADKRADVEAGRCNLHCENDYFCFSKTIVDKEKGLTCCQRKPDEYCGNIAMLHLLKKINPRLKILLSIGGWTFSEYFSRVAADPVLRKNFARNCVSMCRKYKFDGIDIDWEFPGLAQHNGKPHDKYNFTLLLKDIREKFDKLRARGTSLLLTIAVPVGPKHLRKMQVDKIHKYVDWINLMTYHFHGPQESEDKVTNHHSALKAPKVGDRRLCIEEVVKYFLKKGVPAKKLLVGLPLYGISYKNVKPRPKGEYLYAKFNGAGKIRSFSKIKRELIHSGSYKQGWDVNAQSAYLFSPLQKEFISWDNERSIALKCNYVKQRGLGGVMIWHTQFDAKTFDVMKLIVSKFQNK